MHLTKKIGYLTPSTSSFCTHLSVVLYRNILQNCCSCLHVLSYSLLRSLVYLCQLNCIVGSNNISFSMPFDLTLMSLPILILERTWTFFCQIGCRRSNGISIFSQGLRRPWVLLPYLVEPFHHSENKPGISFG
jgi:hypothetical protein